MACVIFVYSGQISRRMILTHATRSFTEGHVQYPMHRFDARVRPNRPGELADVVPRRWR